ncbi:hypothetical protein DENSPDRAFT_872631 [Dentipellis sp. KUC8613]|nr:hypothetical protein DENSPDRAFT_872631 [Dentipellis sp. KUC8613]
MHMGSVNYIVDPFRVILGNVCSGYPSATFLTYQNLWLCIKRAGDWYPSNAMEVTATWHYGLECFAGVTGLSGELMDGSEVECVPMATFRKQRTMVVEYAGAVGFLPSTAGRNSPPAPYSCPSFKALETAVVYPLTELDVLKQIMRSAVVNGCPGRVAAPPRPFTLSSSEKVERKERPSPGSFTVFRKSITDSTRRINASSLRTDGLTFIATHSYILRSSTLSVFRTRLNETSSSLPEDSQIEQELRGNDSLPRTGLKTPSCGSHTGPRSTGVLETRVTMKYGQI